MSHALGAASSDHVPLDVPIQPRQHRNRRVCRTACQTLSAASLTKRSLEQHAAELTPEDFQLLDDNRPRSRADCRDNGLRPCPFVGCRHNLYADINLETGAIIIARPDLEPHEMEHSCVLDLVDGILDGVEAQRSKAADGPVWSFTLEVVAVLLNLTRERARQIEKEALAKLLAQRALPRPEGLDPEADELDYGEERRVCKLANLQVFMSASGAKAQIVHAPGKAKGPRIQLSCTACGKSDSFWFEGWTAMEVKLMAGLACMNLSECCGKPIKAKLEGMPARLHRRRLERERAKKAQIVTALREAGEVGMSQRQLMRAVGGDWGTTARLAKKLAADKASPVRRATLERGAAERFFCTLPTTATTVAT